MPMRRSPETKADRRRCPPPRAKLLRRWRVAIPVCNGGLMIDSGDGVVERMFEHLAAHDRDSFRGFFRLASNESDRSVNVS